MTTMLLYHTPFIVITNVSLHCLIVFLAWLLKNMFNRGVLLCDREIRGSGRNGLELCMNALNSLCIFFIAWWVDISLIVLFPCNRVSVDVAFLLFPFPWRCLTMHARLSLRSLSILHSAYSRFLGPCTLALVLCVTVNWRFQEKASLVVGLLSFFKLKKSRKWEGKRGKQYWSLV